jgi:hypothetical protein
LDLGGENAVYTHFSVGEISVYTHFSGGKTEYILIFPGRKTHFSGEKNEYGGKMSMSHRLLMKALQTSQKNEYILSFPPGKMSIY